MENKYNHSSLYDKEQMEKLKKEAFYEYAKTNNEYIKSTRKKFTIILIIVIFVIASIKFFWGTINLPNVFGYSSSNARYYIVKVNNKQVPVSYNHRHRIPIVPFLVNIDSYYLGNNYIEGYDGFTFYDDNSDEYIISINSNSCFYQDKYQVECTKNTQNMKENNDTKYTNMKITRITNPHEIVYEGKVVKNIKTYLTQKGQYHVEITAKYGLNESKVYFYFEKN